MKRFYFLSLAIIISKSCFAFFGTYYSQRSTEPSGWLTFTNLILAIGGILEIILFFKIWGMTNNIKALKKDYFNETVWENEHAMAIFLRKNFVLGNMHNIKTALLKNFINKVESGFDNLKTERCRGVALGTDEYKKVSESVLNEPINVYVDSLIRQYKKIGEEVPDYIIQMKTFKDYFNLFTSEDLTIDTKRSKITNEATNDLPR